MPRYLGPIEIPEVTPSGTFPLTPDYPHGRAHEPIIVRHQMGPASAGGKIEQAYYVGPGAKRFTVRVAQLTPTEVQALAAFWRDHEGAAGAFIYNAPNEDGTTTAYTCRFAETGISYDYFLSCLCSVGVELIEIPTSNPAYVVSSTETRFPGAALETALAQPVQQIIPLVDIQPREAGAAAIHLSDRLCTVDGVQYEPRLLELPSIMQGMQGESDAVSLKLGNADRVLTQLANAVNLEGAEISYSLYHVATGIKLDIWAGNVSDWSGVAAGEVFTLSADDGFPLNLMYPPRNCSRNCWKVYGDAANGCPGAPGFSDCDQSWANCQARGLTNYFGGIQTDPQAVRTKDNSTGVWGFGRSTLTSCSQVADSLEAEVLPVVFCDFSTHADPAMGLPLNAKIAAGRDEGDFYDALAVACEGPIQFANPNYSSGGTNPHKLDGQDHHGWTSPKHNGYGLRLVPGADPVPAGQQYNFELGEGGDGIQTWNRGHRAAGTAFLEIRRSDEKGLQLSRLSEHAVQTCIRVGSTGYIWSGGVRSMRSGLTNPIWIAVNMLLRAAGVYFAPAAVQEEYFDVAAAEAAAAICDLTVPKILGTGTERQFTFVGVIQERKPVKQWIQEVLNCCLGYYTIAGGKVKFGIRCNSSSVEQFSDGNVIWGSISYEPLKPEFNRLSATFADEEYGFISSTLTVRDVTHAQFLGGSGQPEWRDGRISYVGASRKSQVARLLTTRLREEIGGIRPETYRYARKIRLRTTLLGLTVEPGMVCRLDHPDMPTYPATLPGSVDPSPERPHCLEFRVESWRLNPDFSVDIEGRSTHNEIYDLTFGPKPADVDANELPVEQTFAPANVTLRAYTRHDGYLHFNRVGVGIYPATVHRGKAEIYYIDEAQQDRYVRIVGRLAPGQTSVILDGDAPAVGQWILVDSELCYVEATEPIPGSPGFCTATLKRAQLGTAEADHDRVTTTLLWQDPTDPRHFRVDAGLNIGAGQVMFSDRPAPPITWQYISSYDPSTGDLWTVREDDYVLGEAVYVDPDYHRVQMLQLEIPFQPRFMVSSARANWDYPVHLPHAGVVLVRFSVENTRGISSDPITLYPVSPDDLAPQADGYESAWPHRVRTLDLDALQFQCSELPAGATASVFVPVCPAEAQPFEQAFAEIAGGPVPPIDPPAAIGSVSLANDTYTGTVTLGGAVDADSEVQVAVTGENEMHSLVWRAADEAVLPITLDAAATALAAHLNADPQFAAYYYAEASGAVVQLLDRTRIGGTLAAATRGTITAAAAGFTSHLGVLYGRKYAVAFTGGGYRSELSPLTQSTGPTGGATEIQLRGLPGTADAQVTGLEVYATRDGSDGPPWYLVATAALTDAVVIDSYTEAGLLPLPQYPGPTQPTQAGVVDVTVYRDGVTWFEMQIPADSARSNVVHGLALGQIQPDTEITVDADNNAGAVAFRVMLQ